MYLAVLVLNKAFYHFCIERDNEEIAALMKKEGDWWEEFISGDSVPEPDGSDGDDALIRDRFPDSDGGEVFLGMRTQDFEELSELDRQIKELTIRRDACKQAIMQDMGDASTASALNGWTATWKQQASTRLDSKALKSDYPELYQKYAKTTDTRVFRYKKAK